MSPIIVNGEVNEVVVITHRMMIIVFRGQFATPTMLIKHMYLLYALLKVCRLGFLLGVTVAQSLEGF